MDNAAIGTQQTLVEKHATIQVAIITSFYMQEEQLHL